MLFWFGYPEGWWYGFFCEGVGGKEDEDEDGDVDGKGLFGFTNEDDDTIASKGDDDGMRRKASMSPNISSAFRPALFRILLSAPASINSRTTFLFPTRAAMIRAVSPTESRTLIIEASSEGCWISFSTKHSM